MAQLQGVEGFSRELSMLSEVLGSCPGARGQKFHLTICYTTARGGLR